VAGVACRAVLTSTAAPHPGSSGPSGPATDCASPNTPASRVSCPVLAQTRVQVVQAVPFTEKLVGEASLLVNVPVKPIVTDPDGAMEAS
jgi:hypothetical protein